MVTKENATLRKYSHALTWDNSLKISLESSNTWAISAGKYVIYEDNSSYTIVDFPGLSNQPFPALLNQRNSVYLYLNAAGTVDIEPLAPNEATQKDRLCVGALSSVVPNTFRAAFPFLVDRAPSTAALLLRDNGLVNLDGLHFVPVAGSLLLSVNGGTILAAGRNWFADPGNPHEIVIPAGQPQPFLMNLNGVILDSQPSPTYIFDRVDNGTGSTLATTSTAIANKRVGISRIFISTVTVVQLLPQFTYASMAEARANYASEPWVRPDSLNGGFIHCTTVIAREDVSLATVTDENYLLVVQERNSGGGSRGPTPIPILEAATAVPAVSSVSPQVVLVPTTDAGVAVFNKKADGTGYVRVVPTQTLAQVLAGL